MGPCYKLLFCYSVISNVSEDTQSDQHDESVVTNVQKRKKRKHTDNDDSHNEKRKRHKKHKKHKSRKSDKESEKEADETKKEANQSDISDSTEEETKKNVGGVSQCTKENMVNSASVVVSNKADNKEMLEESVKNIPVADISNCSGSNDKASPKGKRKRKRKRKSKNSNSSLVENKPSAGYTNSPNLSVSFHPSVKGYGTSTPLEHKWSQPFGELKEASHIRFDSDEETVVFGQSKSQDTTVIANKKIVSTSDETVLFNKNEELELAEPSVISNEQSNSLKQLAGDHNGGLSDKNESGSFVNVESDKNVKTKSSTDRKMDSVIVLDCSSGINNTVINISSELEHSTNQGANRKDINSSNMWQKGKSKQVKKKVSTPPVPGQVLVAGAQVFSRQRNKKRPFVPLSKEEQLQTVNTNRSIVIQVYVTLLYLILTKSLNDTSLYQILVS